MSGPSKPDIAGVLGHYDWDGRVSGYGDWKNTRCPFHNDRNPSARVNEEEGIFHCHVCQISGDGYAVIMQYEGVDFVRAKELVKERTGFERVDSPGGRNPDLLGAGSGRPQRLVASRLPTWAKDKHGLGRKIV